MNEKRLKTIKVVTCSICALMYVAGLVMFFLKNLSGGLSAFVFSTLAGLCALYYFRSLERAAEQKTDGADAPEKERQ